ncbi:hypothetical protein BDR07DRAFT_1377837 [Suillus spraguei]|nr:hypothetical protein BDR07DRAFT_1377837 [Suillus spraguei]
MIPVGGHLSVLIFFTAIVAAAVVVVYDWETELIWKQRWSLMTVLYLMTRCIGILYSIINYIGLADRYTAMLGVIMIARLHAMYQRSRNMLIVLVIIFLAINIACGALTVIGLKPTVGEELVLSGRHMCNYSYGGSTLLLASMDQPSVTVSDADKVHVLYFARLAFSAHPSFAGVSSLQLVYFSPEVLTSTSIIAQILEGAIQILLGVQMFVLGPRLILSVREYHAKLVANSDAETSMRSIVFEERFFKHCPAYPIVYHHNTSGDLMLDLETYSCDGLIQYPQVHKYQRTMLKEGPPLALLSQKPHSYLRMRVVFIISLNAHVEAWKKPKRTIVYEIKQYVATYAAAAKSVIRAGFDGVEIHGPNSYLIDQFMQDVNNQRTDKYGRSIDNRATFALEATDAIVEAGGVSESARRICCSIGVGIL